MFDKETIEALKKLQEEIENNPELDLIRRIRDADKQAVLESTSKDKGLRQGLKRYVLQNAS